MEKKQEKLNALENSLKKVAAGGSAEEVFKANPELQKEIEAAKNQYTKSSAKECKKHKDAEKQMICSFKNLSYNLGIIQIN